MDRSLFPEGVEVHEIDLDRTESTKSFHIRQRLIDSAVHGVKSGFGVTVSSVSNQNIDIAAGTGYAPNGEYIELLTPQLNRPLADFTLDIGNIVIATYVETEQLPEAHETENKTENTEAVRGVRISVITEVDFFNLPISDPDFNINALDRTIVIGRVTGNGFGVPLTSSDITNPEVFIEFLTIDQPQNITGVNIVGISDGTPTSIDAGANAFLAYDASLNEFSYQSPGDAYGTPVAVSGDATIAVASNNGDTISLVVVFDLLPEDVGGGPFTDSLTVTRVYDQQVFAAISGSVEPQIKRFSPEDELHRNRVGSGLPTPNNPHGQTLEDILLRVANIPGSLILGTGLLNTLTQSMVPRILTDRNTNSRFTLLWENRTISSLSNIRIYADGSTAAWVFTVNAKYIDDGVTPVWRKDVTGTRATKAFLNDSGISVQIRTTDADWDDVTGWESNPIRTSAINDSVRIPVPLSLGEEELGLTEAQNARITARYSTVAGAERTKLFETRQASLFPLTDAPIRIYGVASNYLGVDALEITQNAEWSNASNTWTRNATGVDSWIIRLQAVGMFVEFHDSSSASPWADNAWDINPFALDSAGNLGINDIFGSNASFTTVTANTNIISTNGSISAPNGIISAGGKITAGTAAVAEFEYGTPVTQRLAIPGITALINEDIAYAATSRSRWARGMGGTTTLTPQSVGNGPAGTLIFTPGVPSSATSADAVWPLLLPHNAIITNVEIHGAFQPNAGLIKAQVCQLSYGTPFVNTLKLGNDGNDLNNGAVPGSIALSVQQFATVSNTPSFGSSRYLWVAASRDAVCTVYGWTVDYIISKVGYPQT